LQHDIAADGRELPEYETPDVSRLGSAESLTAGGATITDPTDPASQLT
jgi:hypothetical protein